MKWLVLLCCVSLVACGPEEEETPSPSTLVDKYNCRGTGLSGTTSLRFEHLVFIMSDGGAMTTCAVVTASGQISAFNMYKPATTGARTGLCEVSADLDGTPDYGFWSLALDQEKGQSVATFRNTGSGEDGRSFTLACSKP